MLLRMPGKFVSLVGILCLVLLHLNAKPETYEIDGDKSKFGIIFEGAMSIPYEKQDGKTDEFNFKMDNIDGYVGKQESDKFILMILFHPVKNVDEPWTMRMIVERNSKKAFFISQLDFMGELNDKLAPSIKKPLSLPKNQTVTLYTTPEGNTCLCNTEKSIELDSKIKFSMSSVTMIAYSNSKVRFDVGPYEQCKEDLSDVYYYLEPKTKKILIEMAVDMSLDVPYIAKNNSKKTFHLKMPKELDQTMFTGTAKAEESGISIVFYPSSHFHDESWMLGVKFVKENEKFYLNTIGFMGTLTKLLIPDIKEESVFLESFLFNKDLTAGTDNILTCNSNIKYTGTANSTLEMSNLKMRAFVSLDEISFDGKTESCPADSKNSKNSTIVPIVIGIVLFVLILVALVLFVVGMKRRQAANSD